MSSKSTALRAGASAEIEDSRDDAVAVAVLYDLTDDQLGQARVLDEMKPGRPRALSPLVPA